MSGVPVNAREWVGLIRGSTVWWPDPGGTDDMVDKDGYRRKRWFDKKFTVPHVMDPIADPRGLFNVTGITT